jgi:hypothetical protein
MANAITILLKRSKQVQTMHGMGLDNTRMA